MKLRLVVQQELVQPFPDGPYAARRGFFAVTRTPVAVAVSVS